MFLEGYHGLFLLGSSSHLVLEPNNFPFHLFNFSSSLYDRISQVVSISLLRRCTDSTVLGR
ncbi:unnamed protein product [Musa hybrid cultivar]